jgi:ATP-binding cassette subfamily B protein
MMENICYGDSDASADVVVKAAVASGIHPFVQTLPDGYDTLLGEDGLNLSEGQRQRLSLARALVMNPDIMILDEPTASLDPATEHAIVDSIMRLFENKTVFIVTHSRQVVEKCDRVILLGQEGRATQGTHEELIQTNTLYQEMFGPPTKNYKRIKNCHENAKIRKHEIDNGNAISN